MKTILIGDVVGDYRVIDIAGAGGMGAVYRIEHVITKRIEAMKLLPPGSSNDPEQVLRFEREIQVHARLHHPNIVALYNAVRDGDTIGLVMEFVEGESLQRKLEAGPLPVEAAVDFASQVLRALAYAHNAGVVHRDVAPANIIITPDRTAKLTDFGLARGVTDLQLSNSGVPQGSPWYMAPEQVRGTGALDPRTDLYAVGAVLHEMLTGTKLFEAEGAFAVMRAQVESEPALPSSRNPNVPAALDDIVRKAVAKDPAMRFWSADEFRSALQSATVSVRPIMLPRLTPRPGWFRPSRAALLVLVPAVLAAGFLTIRFFPPAASAHSPESRPRAAAVVKPDAAETSPAVAVPAGPEAPEVVPPPPPEVTIAIEKPAASPRQGGQVPVQTPQRAGKSERPNGIRITGGEAPPMVTIHAGPTPPRPVEAPERFGQKEDIAATPETAGQSAVMETAPELAEGSQQTAQAKPQNSQSRLGRALGKVNPFRKRTKNDAGDTAKPPQGKD